MSTPRPGSLVPLVTAVLMLGCGKQQLAPDRPPAFDRTMLVLFAPVQPPAPPASMERVELGRMLFFDPRLSRNHDRSCNSCHDLSAYGVDGRRRPSGHRGQEGTRNVPSIYDAAQHAALTWDGWTAELEQQAKRQLLDRRVMAMEQGRVEDTLRSLPGYVLRFEAAFPDEQVPTSFVNATRALAAYMRTLATRSRFDRFVEGDGHALTADELRGFGVFMDAGCPACHVGHNLGGTRIETLGRARRWPGLDEGLFRVAPLKNVVRTGPYFHDGAVADLSEAVRWMERHQLGGELHEAQVELLVGFLRSLTGVPADPELIAPLPLPPSTGATPQPDPA